MSDQNTQCTTIFAKIKAIASIFMPASCIFCRQIVSNEEGMGVCPACFGVLPVWDKADVAMPFIPKNVDSFNAPFLYEEPLNKAISNMKFSDKPEYATPLARLMAAKVLAIKTENTLLLPVPMHKARLFMRQFNQATLLAKGVAKVTSLPVDIFALKRIKKTAPQLGKSAKARKRNLSGAFSVEKNLVEGKNIILIDDVWTTGSTAEACAKCLKKAGANRVDVVSVCFVETPA